jgi:hypothetical protein
MWGNRLGWGISAIIVVATITGLVFVSRSLDTISPPTDFSTNSGAGDALSLPAVPAAGLPSADAGADTGALYHQAVDLYEKDKTNFNQFSQRPRKDDEPAVEPAVDLLRQAAGTTSLGIFAATPQEAVNYDLDSPLKALKVVGDCANGAGLLAKVKGDAGGAQADFQAAFSLGQRMADERLCYAELSDGLGLMSAAAVELGEMAKDAGDQAKADALNQFSTAVTDFTTKKLIPIETVLSTIDDATIKQYVGDIFWVAGNSKERMWRVEAIHALGRVRYNADRPGDNRGAMRVVTQIAQSASDPIIKLAATQARDLTLEDYRVSQ